jgi:transaldolase
VTDPLQQLTEAGVSVWLDDLDRTRITSGGLAKLIQDRSLRGITTNPSIFQKAISGSPAYDDQVHDYAVRGIPVGETLRGLTTWDVRAACDVMRPVYEATDGLDGRVSIEVSPELAHQTEQTIAEARALWWAVDRPNLFIKIPATVEGLPAISQVLSEGISVNVTLIFSLERYDAVMEAFLEGLERRRAAGGELHRLESVASFFVSRVDTEVDKRLEKIGTPEALALRAKAAIANARLAYQHYEAVFVNSPRWESLEDAGARPQRPLWASTSTKDPDLPDTLYVTELVAPGTVNTMPGNTMEATFDHGVIPADSVRGRYDEAQGVLDQLEALGIGYDDVVDVLEKEGVEKFESAWNELTASIEAELKKKAGSA